MHWAMQNSIYIAESDFLNDDRKYEQYYSLQSDIRKSKIDALNNRGSKNNALLAGMLLEKLAKDNGITSYKINTTSNGKPYEQNNLFCFSISHSNNIVAVAFSDKAVGLDLELNTGKTKNNISKRFFSESDREKLQNNTMSFLEIWTRKESYTKLKDSDLILVMKMPDDDKVFFQTVTRDSYILTVCTEEETEFIIKTVNGEF